VIYIQWRTQKIFMGGGFVQWHVVVICIWCALFMTLQFDVTFMFLNQRFGEVWWQGIFFCTHFPYFMCHWTEYKLSAPQVRISEKNKLNATAQQFITTKISSCALKQGSKTPSSLRQSNLQWQNKAALSGVFKGRRARHLSRAPLLGPQRCYVRTFALFLVKSYYPLI